MSEEHKEQLSRIRRAVKELESSEAAQVVAYAEGAAAIASARKEKENRKND